jgi:hypothetical protein
MTSTAPETGTCAYCKHPGETVPASLQPGSTIRQCADRKACIGRLDAASAADAPCLTRAEAAYAHLASFQRGDVVDVAADEFFQPGIVTQAQRADGDDLTAAYVLVDGCGSVTRVTVGSLLDGMTLTLQNEVARGNVRYFDAAGYAAQNG